MTGGQDDAAKYIESTKVAARRVTQEQRVQINAEAIVRVWTRFARMDKVMDDLETRIHAIEMRLKEDE